jgi:hypothetical protein
MNFDTGLMKVLLLPSTHYSLEEQSGAESMITLAAATLSFLKHRE